MPPKRFPGDLSWNMASLVSSWVVGPLYGINICVYILMMLIVASVQFSLATGHVIALLVQLIRAFIGAAGTVDGPSNYLLDQSTPEHLAQGFFYMTNSLIGDAIMVWRLWIIWNRNFWLCAPFIVLCIVSTVTGYAAFANQASLSPTETVFLSRLQNWLRGDAADRLPVLEVRPNSNGLRGPLLSVFWTLVESGALYAVTTIFLVEFSSTNTGAIFAASLGQISALAPTLIIVRAGLKSSGTSSSFTPAKGSINNPYYGPPPPPSFRRDVESGSAGDAPMVMHMNQATAIRLDNMKLRDISESSTLNERSSSAAPKITVPLL
ncbi:hypothetical protein EDB86DRAFT_3084604 [Lactarius hatsudake]|nr:hypothetical protein EDB86DRAFT_3084604 [Lactarius hatsudake]